MKKRLIYIALIAIILLGLFSFYQVKVGQEVEVEKQYVQGFSNNLGELTNHINNREKNKLYKLYKEIFIIEEKKLADGIGERSEREENLRLEFNESLNKLTKKYEKKLLTEDEMEEVEGFENADYEKEKQKDEYREKIVKGLKDYVSEEDYENIISMEKRFKEGEDFDFEYDMDNILKKYTDLDSEMIISQIIEPSEIKGVFKINEDFSISYKPIKVLTTENPSEEVIKESNELWTKINEILPKSQMEYFENFIVFSDGKYDTLAYVQVMEDDLSKYNLSIDYNDVESEDNEFEVTVIHEFGHVLTTNGEEVEYTEKVDPNYYYEEGYLLAKEHSYLNEFYKRYWADIYEDLLVTDTLEDPEEAKSYFYIRHLNKFSTEYCSTSPAEDIAESFALFVMKDKPKGNTVPEQKISFFYEFEEFVGIRKEIREKLNLDY